MRHGPAVCPIRVGRESEVATLRRNAPALRATFLGGPAGIGKSRLAAEAATIATELGYRALVGYCEPGQPLPYGPFVRALRRATRTMPPHAVAELFDGPAMLSAALLPEVARVVGVPDEAPPQSDLFAAVWQLCFRLADGGVLLLELEDLHWADADSLRLLTYLLHEADDLPVWIVGTYRDDELHHRHPLTGVLAELARTRRVDDLRLEPLAEAEVASLVRAALGTTEVDDDVLRALYERSAGNPFFAEELLRHLLEHDQLRGAGVADALTAALPDTVRETLLARTRELDATSHEVLLLAALSGERVEPAVLVAAAGVSSADVDAALEAALRLQLLAEGDGVAGYVFRHALTREALADELVGPERRRGHLRIATAIEQVHADDASSYAAELFDHYSRGGDADRAIAWGRRAADAAAASFAVDEAARRYEQVLALMAPADPGRLEVLEAAVAAPIDAGSAVALAFAREMRRVAHDLGDADAEARAIAALAMGASDSGETARGVELYREALELVEGRGNDTEAAIVSSFCRQLARIDRIDELRARLPGALELAERVGDARALAGLHVASMMASSFGPAFDDSLRAARRAARDARDERAEMGLTQTAGYICVWCGAFGQARASLERSIELGRDLSPHDKYSLAGYAWLLSLLGEYDAARAAYDGTLRDTTVPVRQVALTALYETAERTGNPDPRVVVEELFDIAKSSEAQRTVPALAARARHALRTEGLDVAELRFAEVLATTTRGRGRGSHWLFSPDLARGLLDADRTDALVAWASDVASVTRNDPQPHNLAADALVRAYLAIARRESSAALAAFDEAQAGYAAMPCPARVVEVHLARAEHASREGREADALASADAALGLATSIGATTLVSLARTAQARASAPTATLTVVFSDVVGSTGHVAAMGDAAWRSLLDRHDAIVQRAATANGGRVVSSAGDGVLCVFDSPTRALRFATSLRHDLAAVGLEVRCGAHTGECQLVGDDVVGLAVHVAARVSALAGAAEVLVTSTVRDLVAGSAVRFEDRGTHELRGVPGRWQLLAVQP